jgi:hypothetical protein
MAFLKHRNEKEVFAFDFAARLAAGETLSAPEVKITLQSGTPPAYADKSAEFIDGAPTISGTKVQFTLKAAAAPAEQTVSVWYVAYGKASTSAGRILVSTTELTVTAEGT